MAKEEKFSIALAKAAIEKKYGAGALFDLGETEILPLPKLDSGSLKLNEALGGGYEDGGYGQGRIVELIGDESSGKSTLCLHAIASAQANFPDKKALFIDVEHALDLNYANALGVDTKALLLNQPDNGDQGLDILDTLLRTDEISIAIVDSVAALVPKAELEGDITDSHVGGQARMMSQALRRLVTLASQANTTIIFTNQWRYKIGIMFGDPRTCVTPDTMIEILIEE